MSNGDDVVDDDDDDDDDDDNKDNVVLTLPPEVACRKCQRCLKLGTKVLFCIACSGIGILIVGGLVIYFVFFHNKSGKKTTTVEDATTVTVAVRAMANRVYNEHLKQHLFGNDMPDEKAEEDLGPLPE
ncbi:GL19609 [Drosophila persimilis]|uniref:GL19609 n=1 Tax=Drosophila persimilis TaxID=7234 RepID=B4G7C8_DROPE|nr:GL19609 [Drosophila persimilis]